MYKVVLVDDEILTREAISENTPWEEAGFTLAGTAENGREAISIIDAVRPELVITDITMPVMNGLELSKYIKENYPDTSVIIISGYNEFEYAKKALSYGVMEYLLKPFTPDELLEILKRARDELSKRIGEEEEFESLKAEQESNRERLQMLFVKDILEGRATSRNLISQMENFGMSAVYTYQSVLFVAISNAGDFYADRDVNGDDGDRLLNFAIANITGELIEGMDGVLQFIGTDEKSIYVFSDDTKEGLRDKIDRLSQQFILNISKYLNVKISIIAGEIVEDITDWSVSYASAKEAVKNVFSNTKDSIIYAWNVKPGSTLSTKERDVLLTTYADSIIDCLKKGEAERLHDDSARLFTELRDCHLDRNEILFRIQNIAFAILMQLKSILDPASQLRAQNHEFFQNMQRCRHISELEQQFNEFLDFILNQLLVSYLSVNQKLAYQAKDYIEKNFSREDLSLNDVCTFLGMSPSYFSVVYKNETGETFGETMTRVRMERAKDLLHDPTKKNYEIAEEVGFADPHYFGSVFKKFTGMTPTEYGRKLRGDRR